MLPRQRLLSLVVVAMVAVATGFLVAGQVKAQLLTPSNQVARYQALVRSVQDLEKTNQDLRARIAALRSDINALEAAAADQSATTQALQNQVAELRAHAGLTALHGPGVRVDLGNGIPGPDQGTPAGYLINYQDVQDLANLLFASGAEAVAVSGRRITPLSAFSGSEGAVLIDQGPPLVAPITVLAIGDRNRMVEALADPSSLPDIRARQVRFSLSLKFDGSPDIQLPAYDASLQIPHVVASPAPDATP
jgi:uncharacterized protein YlxW (UPF0749 family)